MEMSLRKRNTQESKKKKKVNTEYFYKYFLVTETHLIKWVHRCCLHDKSAIAK